MQDKSLVIGGVEWRYATAGSGEQTVLLLHDAFGGAETMQPLADALAGEYRVVAPTVADVRTFDEVCDALSAVLDREHVARANVFGCYFGAMIAQAFLKRRWRQVENIVLLGAQAPDRAAGERERKSLKLMRLLPFRLTRAQLRLDTLRQLGAPAPPEVSARVSEFKSRLADYFDRVLTKETLLARVALGVDFNADEVYNSVGSEGWAGRALIIESGDNISATRDARLRLRETYPRALVCTLAGAGRLTPLLMPGELAEVVRAFLKEDYKSPSDLESCLTDECGDDAHVTSRE
ncbi:MAG TPA: alpha/beta hydrolase [Pyrinomonadaceae bacterium]|jgi:pimeloyl-ACP methyl ester carboxylesterase|nr:alpha/beta hydrolase [Pyrinomonadaceae bacterium]